MNKLSEMLRRHEGVETHAYVDTVGKVTIGVGRNIDVNGGMGLSDTEIKYLLSNDISRVELELYNTFDWFDDLGEARGDAMVDICFNLGLPRLLKFKKALAAMDAEDYDTAAYEFLNSRWADQVGNRAIELAEMIRSGSYDDDT